MMLSLVLAAFFFSPSHPGGLKPARSTGDMQTDWQNYSATADSLVVDSMPEMNIRSSWKLMGVKLLLRVAWNPDDSAEYIRRRAGFLAVRAEADGVWLEGEKKFPKAWKEALAEAKVDAEILQHLLALADRALTMRETNHKIWIEGRRAKWFVNTLLPFWTEDLDALRFECLEYARRLEQLLGVKAPKDFPYAGAKPSKEPDRAPIRPLEGQKTTKASVAIWSEAKLSDEVTFKSNANEFRLVIRSKTPCKDAEYPGGRARVKLYVADGRGSYLPYEYLIDLSPVAPNRAPDPGCFMVERWGKGAYMPWGGGSVWRLVPVNHQTTGAKYPSLVPGFDYRRDRKTGAWSLDLVFGWRSLYHFWPMTRTGVSDKWFVSVEALPGVAPVAAQLNWGKGDEANWGKFANATLNAKSVCELWDSASKAAAGIYDCSFKERHYGFLPTKEPTYQCLDAASDKMFKERVIQPMDDAVAAIVSLARGDEKAKREPKFNKMSGEQKLKFWKSLDLVFTFADRLGAARRDYLLLRHAGKTPPEYQPPKKKAEASAAPAAPKGPSLESDDGDIQLDDELEF